jgi:hypothetical protein
MKISFRHLAIITALLFLMLTLTWMFAAQQLMSGWGLVSTPMAELLGRRAAALYAGLAIMFWLARNARPSPARSAMSKGLTVACLMLAALGIFELAAGHVAPGILLAVVIEVALAVAFVLLGFVRIEKGNKK